MTFAVTEQLVLPASDPLLRLNDAGLLAATATPPQVLDREVGMANTRPGGKPSVNARPLMVLELLLVIVTETVDVPPGAIKAGENVFAVVGAGKLVLSAPAVTGTPVEL